MKRARNSSANFFARSEKFLEVFKTEREEISASEVPEDIRRQIEEKNSPIAENFFKAAENYFYGLKGCLIDRNAAKNLYEKAAEEGHKSARNKLKNLFGIDYEEPFSPIAEKLKVLLQLQSKIFIVIMKRQKIIIMA